ncbi:MAG: YbjQ family protein [Anaerolineaceae bacterium]|nr:YbjQ family protein [Anaerolineaceae bacterium]
MSAPQTNLTPSDVIVTTTNNVEGYTIQKYLGIESVEIVIGTGVISEFTSAITDIFGERATAFERKLGEAKQTALLRLQTIALQRGANAIVGVDIDYTEFQANRIGVVINGTLVSIQPAPAK